MNTPIRLLIIANHPNVLTDMLTIFQLADEVEVIGTAASLEEAICLSRNLHPDVALVDLEMSGAADNGYSVVSQLKVQQLTKAIVALTSHDYPAARRHALACGADMILIKGTDFQSMTQELIAAARGTATRRC